MYSILYFISEIALFSCRISDKHRFFGPKSFNHHSLDFGIMYQKPMLKFLELETSSNTHKLELKRFLLNLNFSMKL